MYMTVARMINYSLAQPPILTSRNISILFFDPRFDVESIQKIRFGKYADDFYFSSNVTHALTICPQMQVKVALLYNILGREMENV